MKFNRTPWTKRLVHGFNAIYFLQRAVCQTRLSAHSTGNSIMDLSGPGLGRTPKMLHRKSWQNAVLSMTNTTDASWVYQTSDRADDGTDRAQRLVCLVTIFQQPPPTYPLPLSAIDRGPLAPGWFCDGLLTGLLFSQCWREAPLYLSASLGHRVYLCPDIYTPHVLRMNGRASGSLVDGVFTRTSYGKCFNVGFQFNAKEKESMKILRLRGHSPWPRDLKIYPYTFKGSLDWQDTAKATQQCHPTWYLW